MKSILSLIMAAMLFPGLALAQTRRIDKTPVKDFDLYKYLGMWYEIARFDHRDGKFKMAAGIAKQPNPMGNPAHLRVSFFLFFYSDYNILMLADNYNVALVGSGSSDYLWILSRTPVVSDEILIKVIDEAKRRGYNTSRLIWVDQGATTMRNSRK